MTGFDRVVLCVTGPNPSAARSLTARARRRGFRRFARPFRGGYVIEGSSVGLRPRAIRTPEDLSRALAVTGPGQIVLLRWAGDRIIPLENALAGAAGRIQIAVLAETPDEVPAALGALEHGAALVLVRIGEEGGLHRLEALLERPVATPPVFRPATVERIVPVGVGDRVLVDTTRLLRPDAGLLVGSTARFLFVVASEAEGSAFSGPRPFRVNAGAPHSYVLLADGTTRYLSELVAADRLLVARPGGPVESARVGRLKVERRPMVLIEARRGASRPTIFLQEAETVRLVGRRGPIAVTDLARGDRVLGVELAPGRHLGQVVEEHVEER
ncbi:MAG TPA: 3-dehydroquinate synthase II [Thermoplasmata archaeon]|nr:3-dehydroquinate synthase II [Thermoplasmata archaeon]